MTPNHVDEPGEGTGITPAGDEALLLQVRAGNTEAFAGLYERHIGSAMLTARGYARNPSDISDLVAEAFAKVLEAIQAGHGPTVFFRAYLLTTLRRLATAKQLADEKNVPTDDLEAVMGASRHKNPAVAAFETEVVGRSFKDLPERWQAVLWYSEVDGMTPADMAPMMGISANAVAALSLRAREGLKQAYLQNHVLTADAACRYYADNLGAYARGGLTRRRSEKVEAHLHDCLRCTETLLHLNDVGAGMRSVIFPALLGFSVVGKGAIGGSGVALGVGKLSASGRRGAGGAVAGTAGPVGAAVAASAIGLLLVAAVVVAAVVQPSLNAGSGTGPLASSMDTVSPAGIAQLPAAPSIRALEPAPQPTESQAAGPQLGSGHDLDHGVQQPAATRWPSLVPTARPTPSPSASPHAPRPSLTPDPSSPPSSTTAPPSSKPASPSSSTAPPSPSPTPTPTWEGGSILASAAISRWGFPTATVRVSLSHAGQDELRNATVSFAVAKYWVEVPLGISSPDGWDCVDASSAMLGQATCTAASWQPGAASFDLTVPTMSIVSGYPMTVAAAATGAVDFNETLFFLPSN